jgi:hypothetical protein
MNWIDEIFDSVKAGVFTATRGERMETIRDGQFIPFRERRVRWTDYDTPTEKEALAIGDIMKNLTTFGENFKPGYTSPKTPTGRKRSKRVLDDRKRGYALDLLLRPDRVFGKKKNYLADTRNPWSNPLENLQTYIKRTADTVQMRNIRRGR